MKILKKYDDPFEGKKRGEVPNPETPCYVDPVGFISMEQQIKGLINAGINLENYRRTQYDYQYVNEVDIDEVTVSAENDPDFMPSIDIPNILSSMATPNSSPAAPGEPPAASETPGGDITPPEHSEAL